MKTEHTFRFLHFPKIDPKKDPRHDLKITVEHPDLVEGDVVKGLGDKLPRFYELACGFNVAHHIQSKLRQALITDPAKRTKEQIELLDACKRGDALQGLDFLPDKREAKVKDDAVITALRKAWDDLDDVAKAKVRDRYRIPSTVADDLEAYISHYREYLKEEAKKKEQELNSLLGIE